MCACCTLLQVAAERQLPEITGYRLARMGAAAALDSGARLALPAHDGQAGSTALVPAGAVMPALTEEEWRPKEPGLLMRPPTALTLPLRGFACDCRAWAPAGWEVA